MKRGEVKRIWTDALMKVEAESACRVCSRDGDETNGPLEAAHTIGRKHDEEVTGPRGGRQMYVNPLHIVPLCSMHHRSYDARGLDLLPYLNLDEQEATIKPAEGIENARIRLCPLSYRKGAA